MKRVLYLTACLAFPVLLFSQSQSSWEKKIIPGITIKELLYIVSLEKFSNQIFPAGVENFTGTAWLRGFEIELANGKVVSKKVQTEYPETENSGITSSGSFIGFSQKTGTFTDARDGKTYRTVKIGNQWLMAENLAYKAEDGKCWAYKNDENNVKIYGYLYDWETAQKVAPKGWHLPGIEEWEKIYQYFGGSVSEVRAALRKGGKSGFNLTLGGTRNLYGFSDLGKLDIFWSSTPTWDFFIWSFKNVIREMNAYKYNAPRKVGCSVRLFKDISESELWIESKSVGSNQAYLEYLNLFPKGLHADSARLILTQFKEKEAQGIINARSAGDKILPGVTIEEVISLLLMGNVVNRDFAGGLYIGMGVFPESQNEKSVFTGTGSLDGYDIRFENGKVISKTINQERLGSNKANFRLSIK